MAGMSLLRLLLDLLVAISCTCLSCLLLVSVYWHLEYESCAGIALESCGN